MKGWGLETIFNEAHLVKWLWRFGVEETQLWRCVIAFKFREDWRDGDHCLLGVSMFVVFGGV